MATASPLCVLVVDDDADTRANLFDILELDGYRVETAGSVAETLDRRNWGDIDAVILDRKLPDGSAEELLPRLKQLAPEAAVIIVTGYADLEGAIAAIRQGAADYLLKPVNLDLLRARLAGIAERKRRRKRSPTSTRHSAPHGGPAYPAGRHPHRHCHRRRAGVPIHPREQVFRPCAAVGCRANASVSAPADERPNFKIFQDGQEVLAEELPMQRAAARGEEVRDVEIDIVFPDGAIVHLFGYAAPLLDEHGLGRGAVGAFLDITEREKCPGATIADGTACGHRPDDDRAGPREWQRPGAQPGLPGDAGHGSGRPAGSNGPGQPHPERSGPLATALRGSARLRRTPQAGA